MTFSGTSTSDGKVSMGDLGVAGLRRPGGTTVRPIVRLVNITFPTELASQLSGKIQEGL